MAEEIREQRVITQDYPNSGAVVENEYDYTVRERRGLSGGAIVALVIGAMITAIIITLLIVNGQQADREEELALERERAAAAARAAERDAAQGLSSQQQPSQPSVVVIPPQSQPSTVPVPVPVPAPAQSAPPAQQPVQPSNTSIEVDVNSKLLDDAQLRTYPIIVRFDGGTLTMTGSVPSEELKMRAERLALTVKGVRRIINEIEVKG